MMRSIVLPAYNEAGYIERMIERCVTVMEHRDDPFEIIVIDNASTDETAALVAGVSQRDQRVRLVRHDQNRLYAGSCATGIAASAGDRIFIMDSDGQHDPGDIWKFDTALDAGADVVFGWRRRRREPPVRIALSHGLRLLSRAFLGFRLHDVNCGIRGFNRRFAAAAEIRHRINMVNPELWTRARLGGFVVGEVEVEQDARQAGVSSQEFNRAFRMLSDVLTYLRALRRELRTHGQP